MRGTGTWAAPLLVLVPLVPSCGDGDATNVPSGTTSTSTFTGSWGYPDVGAGSSGTTEGGSSSTGDAPPAEAELPRALAVLACEVAAACDCPNYDPGKCVTEYEVALQLWQDAAMELGLVYDPQCWQQIEIQVEQHEGCGGFAGIECRLYSGDLPLGAACVFFRHWSSDCAAPLTCVNGECLDPQNLPPPLQDGDECYDPQAYELLGYCDSEAGLVCDFEMGFCVVPPAPGYPCEDGLCGYEAWCDVLDDDGPVCKLKLPPHAPCTSREQCESHFCFEGTCSKPLDESCFFGL